MSGITVDKEIENLMSIISKLKHNLTHAEGRLSAYTDLKKSGVENIELPAKEDKTVYDDDI